MRKRLFAPILLSTLLVFTASCGITGVKQCRLEQRAVSASGQFVLADASTITAHVDLAEQRQSSLYPSEARVLVGAQSYSLYGHMTHAELRDSHTPSRLFGSYLPGVGQETWAPNLIGLFSPYDWPLTLDEARALIESGSGDCYRLTKPVVGSHPAHVDVTYGRHVVQGERRGLRLRPTSYAASGRDTIPATPFRVSELIEAHHHFTMKGTDGCG